MKSLSRSVKEDDTTSGASVFITFMVRAVWDSSTKLKDLLHSYTTRNYVTNDVGYLCDIMLYVCHLRHQRRKPNNIHSVPFIIDSCIENLCSENDRTDVLSR